MVGSGPVVRRRASGTMTVRWFSLAGAQAVVDEGEFAVGGVQAAELLVGLAGSGQDPAHRTDVVDRGAVPEQVVHRGARAVQEVEGDALGDGDAGLVDAAVGGQDDGSGGGDAGLGAVAEQAGEPVVGEAHGGGSA